jgi:hypothetical protein
MKRQEMAEQLLLLLVQVMLITIGKFPLLQQ